MLCWTGIITARKTAVRKGVVMSDVTNVTDVADVADVVSRVVDELDRFKKSKMNREPVYKPKGRKLKHSKVPEYIYSHIQPVEIGRASCRERV